MPDWLSLDVNQILAVLQYLVILFFVAAGAPLVARRRHLRKAAIAAYLCALLLALAWIAVWLWGRRPIN